MGLNWGNWSGRPLKTDHYFLFNADTSTVGSLICGKCGKVTPPTLGLELILTNHCMSNQKYATTSMCVPSCWELWIVFPSLMNSSANTWGLQGWAPTAGFQNYKTQHIHTVCLPYSISPLSVRELPVHNLNCRIFNLYSEGIKGGEVGVISLTDHMISSLSRGNAPLQTTFLYLSSSIRLHLTRLITISCYKHCRKAMMQASSMF